MFFKIKNKDYISICNMSQELRRIMPSEELPSCIFKIAQKAVNADDGSICIKDENANKMDIVYVKENKKHGHAFLTDKINSMVVDKGEPLLFNDLIKEEEFQCLDEKNSIKSWLSVPMAINDKIVGVINLVVRNCKKKFDKKDVKLIMIFANQAAAAIQNARDYEKLKELDKLKSEFLTIVSHELRTPLTGIIGFARTLLTLDLPDEQKENYLKIIESEGKRLSCLVENFLDISKMESGNMGLQIDSICLPSIIKEIIEEVEIIKNIKVELYFSKEFPLIEADCDRIRQVVMNIIDNAIKYADVGGKIWIKGEDKGDIIEVSIKDDGPGMDKEEVKRIFDKFYRHDKKSRGCGLGLTIAKGIVEAHKGKMWVESNPGEGSKMIFVLPKKRVA